jgi:hypothetical protein
MKAERLVAKLELQAEREWLHKEQERRRTARQQKPLTRAEANINKIVQLEKKTFDCHYELATQRMLAVATKQNQDASVALYLANMTPAEKAENENDLRRMAFHYSSLCPELSPSWQEEAAAAFRNRKL